MTERKLSELQKEYREFFLDKLRLFNVESPAALTKEKKSEFFSIIKHDWAEVKLFKKQVTEKKETTLNSTVVRSFKENPNLILKQNAIQDEYKKRYEKREGEKGIKQIIISEPNNEQNDDLKILFHPNTHFAQDEKYQYPVVKMPKSNSTLKLPRIGRSNQKGYKEDDFYQLLASNISELILSNNFHLTIPNHSRPYEPDFVLYKKNLNLYIDIEIDEPYDGFYRFPTHNCRVEDDFKQDNIRDLFFTESGWVVIRFTEKQIHIQPTECIDYIRNVLNSILKIKFDAEPKCEIENQWNGNQCIQWQLENYRENYLGIPSFQQRMSTREIVVMDEESETIETKIDRTQFEDIQNQFEKDLHKYFDPKDKTGNAEYISVTTLVERFFQFNLLRYIEKKAQEENKLEEEVLYEHLHKTYIAATLGTELHLQIEKYLTKQPFDSGLLEFKYFLNFENEKLIPNGLACINAEKKIFYTKYKVAGTVDCLFKNAEGKYIMVDWKRSKKLIVQGTNKPDKRGFPIEIPGLTNLSNCSYYRYCIQQNLYKYILEKEEKIIISDMILVVLHENFSDYHTIKLPEMITETEIIFNSINHKI